MKSLLCFVALFALYLALECPQEVRDASEDLIDKYRNTSHHSAVVLGTTHIPSNCTKQCVKKNERRVSSRLQAQQECVDTCCKWALTELKKELVL
uniref:Uncharacterized protein n=1 Tax=Trichuris muris TaxID=70415 RepID=A0A5S6QPW2_TRIMR